MRAPVLITSKLDRGTGKSRKLNDKSLAEFQRN